MYTYVDDMTGLETFGGLLAAAVIFLIIMAVIGLIIGLAVATVNIVSNYKLFQKAGVPGWKQFIPIYADWYKAKIGIGPGYEYIGLIPWVCIVLQVIPYIGWIFYFLTFVQYWYVAYKYAQSFGAGPVLQVITALFEVIGEAILAFSQGFNYLGYWGQALGLPRMNTQNPEYNYNAGYSNGYNSEYNGGQDYNSQEYAGSEQRSQETYEQSSNFVNKPVDNSNDSNSVSQNTKVDLQKDEKSNDDQSNNNEE